MPSRDNFTENVLFNKVLLIVGPGYMGICGRQRRERKMEQQQYIAPLLLQLETQVYH